jgi:hypothetical protein
MSYRVSWLVEQRMVYAYFEDNLTVEALQSAIAEIQHCIEEGRAPVHVLSDVIGVKHMEANLLQLRTVTPVVSPHAGWILVVVNNPLLRFFSSLMVQFAHSDYRFFATVDEALAFLKSIDSEIAAALQQQQR